MIDINEVNVAKRLVAEKRFRRLELMNMGLSFEHACLIVNKEYNNG